ncbi:MAG: hypothetical protein IJI73_11105 [Kiritimatiellae bacterium]|nr:hypothetical protein [Kiritimatiellia bacterium]
MPTLDDYREFFAGRGRGARRGRPASRQLTSLRFSWTSTIDVDGNMVSTPLVVERIGAANGEHAEGGGEIMV